MAEKNRRFSPFVYCSNNPVNRIDPDGMLDDWFTIDEEGYIKRVEEKPNDNFDILMTKEAYNTGDINKENSIQVNDKTILPDLAEEPNLENKPYGERTKIKTTYFTNEQGKREMKKEDLTPTIKGHIATTNSKSEAKKVFEFAASNSNVEWRLSGFKNGSWMVGTIHKNALSPSFSVLGEKFSLSNRTYDAHSHSGTDPRIDFMPSGEDITTARKIKAINPSAQSWLYMPKNPKRKWLEIK